MSLHKKKYIMFFFVIFFITIITAPSIILTIDDTADIAVFYGENEEEEKEGFKLLFDFFNQEPDSNLAFEYTLDSDMYFFKTYVVPHRNLISPPPDMV